MHGHTQGGVQDQAPVPQLIAEALNQQVLLAGYLAGRLCLLCYVGQQVIGGPLIQTKAAQAGMGGTGVLTVLKGQLPGKGPQGPPQIDRTARRIPVPEGQAPGHAGGRGHRHPVVGDILNPPGRGPQGNDVPGPGLIDHLLI